jgi:hypothetical protein
MKRLSILSVMFVLICAQACWSQAAKSTITGTVVDNSGAALKGARLELQPLKLVGETDPQGEFSLFDVPAGS